MDLVIRFVIGGAVVSVFALLADLLRPKGFAGLFSAAPSVAIVTLGLTVHAHGALYAAQEARSMIAGEVAFLVYALLCVYLMAVRRARAKVASIAMLGAWAAVALGLYISVLTRWS